MKVIEMTIVDPAGLHARPASLLVKEANKYQSEIDLEVADKKTTLKSILGIMSLGVKVNTPFKITIEGEDEGDAEIGIVDFLKAESLAQ